MIRIVNRHGAITETNCKTLTGLEKEYTILRTDNILMPDGVRYSVILKDFKFPVVANDEVYAKVKTFWNETEPEKSKFKAEKLIGAEYKLVSISNKLAKEIFKQNDRQNK
jgi:hypothetical protein